MQARQGVAVDLDLDGRAEAEIGGPLELEVHALGALQAAAEAIGDDLLVGGRRAGRHPHLQASGVLPFAAGAGQRQTAAADDAGVRGYPLIALDGRLDVGDEAVRHLQRGPLGKLDDEAELPLREGRDEIEAEARHEPDRGRERGHGQRQHHRAGAQRSAQGTRVGA